MGSGWPIQLKTALGAGTWAALAAIPLCIVLLYFLKLRRQPVVVPSTLLWRRSMEDLRVNSLFQRLRRNILLILQLATVGLIMAALAGPFWSGTGGRGKRVILAIDHSASMAAKDVSPDRLSVAKRRAIEIVDSMTASDLVMLIAFADKTEVLASYTSNKSLLRQKIDGIEPTDRRTSLREALQVADGLANPSRQAEGAVATEETNPQLVIFTDGGLEDVTGFSLGNLEPELVIVGQGPPEFKVGQSEESYLFPTRNQAILTLQTRRSEEKSNTVEVFGRLRNFDAADSQTEIRLYRLNLDGSGTRTLVDALKVNVPGTTEQGFQFTVAEVGPQALMAECLSEDDLKVDNVAYAVVAPERKPNIRLVSQGNRYLSQYFRSPGMKSLINYFEIVPEDLKKPEIKRELSLGTDALVIFDRCAPEESPQSDALYFGAFPPGDKFGAVKKVEGPVVLDWDSASPLMQYIRDLSLVRIGNVQIPEKIPAGARPLIESDKGTLAMVVPREGFQDVVVGFALLENRTFNTDWFLKYSFPLFLNNSLSFLAGVGGESAGSTHAPGDSFSVSTSGLAGQEVKLQPLAGEDRTALDANVDSSGRVSVTASGRQGVFAIRNGEELIDLFAVNLFSERESDLSTRGLAPAGAPAGVAEKYQLKIGFTPLTGSGKASQVDKPLWKWAVVAGLVMLLVEWFVYNRRVML